MQIKTKKILEILVSIDVIAYICNRLKDIRSLSLESCLSGRKDMFAKHAYGKLYQGFESLTLRFFTFGV